MAAEAAVATTTTEHWHSQRVKGIRIIKYMMYEELCTLTDSFYGNHILANFVGCSFKPEVTSVKLDPMGFFSDVLLVMAKKWWTSEIMTSDYSTYRTSFSIVQ